MGVADGAPDKISARAQGAALFISPRVACVRKDRSHHVSCERVTVCRPLCRRRTMKVFGARPDPPCRIGVYSHEKDRRAAGAHQPGADLRRAPAINDEHHKRCLHAELGRISRLIGKRSHQPGQTLASGRCSSAWRINGSSAPRCGREARHHAGGKPGRVESSATASIVNFGTPEKLKHPC